MIRKKIKETDINILAKSIVTQIIEEESTKEEKPEKNPAAVALGRLGGQGR